MPNLLDSLSREGFTKDRLNVLFNTGLNCGDKPVIWDDKNRGFNRINRFAEWCFYGLDGHTIIVVGHSLWFRRFFNCFLPHDSTHKSKTNKMQNVAAVAFNFRRHVTPNGWTAYYKIDEDSIVECHKGFM